jgi:hypothetical protein
MELLALVYANGPSPSSFATARAGEKFSPHIVLRKHTGKCRDAKLLTAFFTLVIDVFINNRLHYKQYHKDNWNSDEWIKSF